MVKIKDKLNLLKHREVVIPPKDVVHKYSFWWSFRSNVKSNFLSYYIWAMVLGVIFLFIADFFLFQDKEYSFYQRAFTVNTSIIAFALSSLMLTKNTRTVITYLYFVLIAKGIATFLMFISHDIGELFNTAGINSELISTTFVIMSSLISIGISFLSILLVVGIGITFIINLLDAKVLDKISSTGWRRRWYIFLVLFEIAIFYVLFRFINNFYYEIAQGLFDDIMEKLVPVLGLRNAIHSTFKILRTLMSFGWFPLIITINNIRSTNIFSSKNAQFYVATQFVFLNTYVNVLQGSSLNLFIPKLIIAYTVFKITLQIVLFVVAIKRIKGLSDNASIMYIPPRISFANKTNSSVKLFRYSKKYRMYKENMKAKKKQS